MMTPRTILLPTDFSGRCDRPRDRAMQLARQWGARLVVFHVRAKPDHVMTSEEQQEEVAFIEARLRAEVQDEGVTVETRLGFGNVAEAVLGAATEAAADLIATGISRHDDLGDFIIGTTVERLVRNARAPVLVVKEPVRQDYRRFMVATDFSDCSAEALRTGFAMLPRAEATLLHAYQVPLEALRGRDGPAAALQAQIALELDTFLGRLDMSEDARDRLQVNVDYGDVCQVARDHVQFSNTDLAAS
ncbi:MAG: universal stress protein [Sphingomonadaceae bacterium]